MATPTRSLRLKLTFDRNPACLDTRGEVEHWRICVYEIRLGSIKWPFEVTGDLEWISIPERWYMREESEQSDLELERFWDAVKGCPEGWVRVPAHQITIPGVKVDTLQIPSFHSACVRARERALCLSGYMLPGEWLVETKHEWDPKGTPQEEVVPPSNLTPALSGLLHRLGIRPLSQGA